MNFGKHTILALAAAAMMAACGGGSGPAPTPATPQQALQAIQAKAAKLRADAVPIADAASQLMDFAEQTFPEFFPSNQQNNSAPPFLFRYYAATNNYLGVATTNDGPFVESNVYIVGDSFGNTLANPITVGPLTNFITPTGGGGGGEGGTGNGCFDLALADTQGTIIDVRYQYSGTITGNTKVLTTVGAMTTFEGQSARETDIVTSVTAGMGLIANLAATGKTYSLREGDNMRHVGSQISASVSAAGFTTNTTIKSIYTPPYLDTQYSLAMGASVTVTAVGQSTTTVSIPGSPFPIPPTVADINTSVTHTYVTRESVTVPAGTFQACKYTTAPAGGGVVSTTWYALPKGIPVKITSEGQVIEATQATVNGAAI